MRASDRLVAALVVVYLFVWSLYLLGGVRLVAIVLLSMLALIIVLVLIGLAIEFAEAIVAVIGALSCLTVLLLELWAAGGLFAVGAAVTVALVVPALWLIDCFYDNVASTIAPLLKAIVTRPRQRLQGEREQLLLTDRWSIGRRTSLLLHYAACLLPATYRERFLEEWASHLSQLQGSRRLRHTLSLLTLGAVRLAIELRRDSFAEEDA